MPRLQSSSCRAKNVSHPSVTIKCQAPPMSTTKRHKYQVSITTSRTTSVKCHASPLPSVNHHRQSLSPSRNVNQCNQVLCTNQVFRLVLVLAPDTHDNHSGIVLSLRQFRERQVLSLHLFRAAPFSRGAYSAQYLFFVCTPIPSVTHIPVSVSMSVLAFS